MSFNPFAPLFEVPTRLNLPIENHKEFAIISTTGIIGFLAHSIFLLLFWYFDVDFMAYLNIGSILIFAAIYYINRHSVGKSSLLIIIASLEIIVHAIFAVFILGWTSNFHLYLFVPILAAFLVGKVNGISSYILNLFSISVYVFLAVYMNYNNPLRSISEAGMFTFEIMNVINVSSTIIIVTMYYNYVTNEAVKNLAKLNDELKEQSQNVMNFNSELAQQTEELQIQSEQLTHSNKHTIDSIRYALRIQEAVLPSVSELNTIFGEKNVMIFYNPKDIVSGDFYWAKEKDNNKIIVVADCTGHGVPGAMLTMIGESLLNNIVLEKGITEPALILDSLQVYFSTLFEGSIHNIQDGMDISISNINKEAKKLYFAGARNSLTYIQNGKMETIKGDKMSIGHSKIKSKSIDKFTSHQIDISVPTMIYMYTDGYQDQFGGRINRKFYSKNLRALFFDIHQMPMSKQRTRLKMTFVEWCDFAKQTDDVTIVGIKID
ncbi:Stage II sporulation protein E (SpoIIE) [Bernardetia litoralis DSM 6794]|uniref:Stage II sporulation protein E (SpoIIE) n=1 Tax=Bernardetia litoralis (strain ATCC 23117 / DSM 6794 / NBRC 15988 / NCIMB 1366 / Fx l1 / Sio-4) TaxID=880071 RepID=I4AME3_BERLS|nr:SpoIIE family protein phosphatase [Bernardetia litoralis]AFM05128.1 Stage II sporulation protein E (SpoIIE) [Bernardetia litoralis DSM 6794]